tara:strand:+ start:222 stop:626 length:405 start_codon:yes stop_codon:yes gene_type:complete
MIKVKRLKNLNILKEKALSQQRNEAFTLSNELKKTKLLTSRLKNILNNVETQPLLKAKDLGDVSKFNIKIIDQIGIAENRVKFLDIELNRAKKNLGKLMQQKKIINNKISYLTKLEVERTEKRISDNNPSRIKT